MSADIVDGFELASRLARCRRIQAVNLASQRVAVLVGVTPVESGRRPELLGWYVSGRHRCRATVWLAQTDVSWRILLEEK